MKTSEELSTMSIQEVAQAIEAHHAEANVYYEALGSKIAKKTEGALNLGDEKLDVAEYWLKIAKEYRGDLPMNFDLNGFEEAVLGFKFMVDYASKNGKLTVKLKTARETASKDCRFFSAQVRKRVQELSKNPVYALILEKEPNKRQAKEKAKDAAETPTATPATN